MSEKVVARPLDRGMGVAVASRTVFRPEDHEDMALVAERVARGNMSLVGVSHYPNEERELVDLIASGALITSGRHLQHGDAGQKNRPMEVFSNCSTAATSFAKFYLLLNGSGVGASYDDDIRVVDWAMAPKLIVCLSERHKDFPRTHKHYYRFAKEFGLLEGQMEFEDFAPRDVAIVKDFLDQNIDHNIHVAFASANPGESCDTNGHGTIVHRVGDSREGWAKALEVYESMAFACETSKTLVLDFSDVRPNGSPIGGMQNRPASGPLSVMRAFINIRNHVVPAAMRGMEPWEQAMHVDHHLSVEVQVGGARRAARMATKNWRDNSIRRFIRIKSEGGLWTSNNSVMVDAEFWDRVKKVQAAVDAYPFVNGLTVKEAVAFMQKDGIVDAMDVHAYRAFTDVTHYSYMNGEPGFINGDQLEDFKTGFGRAKPIYENGEDFGSLRYQATHASKLLRRISQAAAGSDFPVIVNPCGEIPLHVTGGYCVLADVIPLFACPQSVDFATFVPGDIPHGVAHVWDRKAGEAVRAAVRFLMRVNTMDALYSKEVERTNRVGVSLTGIHEYAWVRFGYGWRDLIDESKSQPFWNMLQRLSNAAKVEAAWYAEKLGRAVPHTVTTIKPAGSTSKLYGVTEGAHLPAHRQYVRWVQFKGQRGVDGHWQSDADPLLAEYEGRGYPIRELKTFQCMSIVGFPTVPLIARLGMGDELVTASEASPDEQYQWLRLLEKYWLGAKQGGQISYTLKVYTDRHDLHSYRKMMIVNQPTVRCAAVMPTKSSAEMGFEYLPEDEVALDAFAEIVSNIRDDGLQQEIDINTLLCASGACPI